MSYKFGQYRRRQSDVYSKSLEFTLNTIQEESPLSAAVNFNEKVIDLSGDNTLQYVDETGLKRRNYYLRCKIHKMWDTSQIITLKLINTLKTTDNIQTLTTFTVDEGYENDYMIFDIVIPPNAVYNQIQFFLNRIVDDYNQVNDDGTYGRIINIEIERLEEINNVIDILNSAIDNKGQLKQIGIQGPPGLQMCIDGEEIKIGRSGLYEINNGVVVNFIGFVVEPNDNKYFILDYQY